MIDRSFLFILISLRSLKKCAHAMDEERSRVFWEIGEGVHRINGVLINLIVYYVYYTNDYSILSKTSLLSKNSPWLQDELYFVTFSWRWISSWSNQNFSTRFWQLWRDYGLPRRRFAGLLVANQKRLKDIDIDNLYIIGLCLYRTELTEVMAMGTGKDQTQGLDIRPLQSKNCDRPTYM